MTVQSVPSPATTRRTNPIDRLWRLITDDRVLGVLIGLLVLSMLLTRVLPQVPAEVLQQGTAKRWLVETQSRYGVIGAMLQAVGLFDIRHSLWLRAVLGLLAFVLLLRLAEGLDDAVRRWQQRNLARLGQMAQRWPLQVHLHLAGVGTERPLSSSERLKEALVELVKDLRSEGWQAAAEAGGNAVHVAAERSRPGLWAGPLGYLGLLLILLALWLNQMLGWQETGITLLPGQITRLNHHPEIALTLLPQESGKLALVAQSDERPPATRTLPASGRVRLHGLSIHRIGEGLALAVTAQDAEGRDLSLQTLEQEASLQTRLDLVFDQPRAERVFLVPEYQLAFSVVAFPSLPERGFTGPTYLVQAFQVGQRQPILNQFVEGTATFVIEDNRYQLRSGRYLTVSVRRDPGWPLLMLGGLLLAVAALLAIWRPAGQLYLHLRPTRRTVEVTASLRPSPVWRQGGRWLAAWASTYQHGQEAEL